MANCDAAVGIFATGLTCISLAALALICVSIAECCYKCKAARKRKQIAKEWRKIRDEKHAERPLSEGDYVNPKVKPNAEYEEGYYEDDTYYQRTPPPRYQTIEEKARALNKSVIELHFGM